MKAYRSLLKTALLHGLKFTIDDGEEEFPFTGIKDAINQIEAVEEAWVNFSDGWRAYVLPYGVDDDEGVADWTTTLGKEGNWIDAWSDAYSADNTYPGTPPPAINIDTLVDDGGI